MHTIFLIRREWINRRKIINITGSEKWFFFPFLLGVLLLSCLFAIRTVSDQHFILFIFYSCIYAVIVSQEIVNHIRIIPTTRSRQRISLIVKLKYQSIFLIQYCTQEISCPLLKHNIHVSSATWSLFSLNTDSMPKEQSNS